MCFAVRKHALALLHRRELGRGGGVDLLVRDLRVELAEAPVELALLALERDPRCGQLLLDLVDRAVARLEAVALRLRDLPFGVGLRQLCFCRRELCLELALPRGDALGFRGELCSLSRSRLFSRLRCALALGEGLRSLECGPFACGEGLLVDLVAPVSALRPEIVQPRTHRWASRFEASLQLGKLALARGDRLRPLSERLLELLDLRLRG